MTLLSCCPLRWFLGWLLCGSPCVLVRLRLPADFDGISLCVLLCSVRTWGEVRTGGIRVAPSHMRRCLGSCRLRWRGTPEVRGLSGVWRC